MGTITGRQRRRIISADNAVGLFKKEPAQRELCRLLGLAERMEMVSAYITHILYIFLVSSASK